MNVAEAFTDHPDLYPGSLIDLGIRAASDAITVEDTGPRPMVEWQHDPVGWAEKVLGIPANTLRWSLNEGYEDHEWDGTPDPIAEMMGAVARNENAAVEAGTGTGKSFGCAVLTLWFVACWEDSRVFSYAPKGDQLRLYMWAEIAHLWPKFKAHFPTAELTDLRIRMRPGSDKWGAWGYSVAIRAGETSATAAQGAHAEHMLLIVEEAPGVHPAIFEALENTRTGEHNIQLVVGNPDAQSDPLHQFAIQPGVTHIRASAHDFPNVVTGRPIVPGAVGRAAVESRRWKYRNNPAMYDSRVRGISPEYRPGQVLQYRAQRHLETFTEAMVKAALGQKWWWYAGIDFGAWRFSWLLGGVDRVKRIHLIDEVFSGFGVTLDERALQIAQILEAREIPPDRLLMVGDSANQTDILEINRAWKKLHQAGKVHHPWHVIPVKKVSGGTKGFTATAVDKLNTLLGNDELLFRRGLGSGLEWRLGASTTSDGDEMHGSRLLWELLHWAYPEPKRDDEPQKQDPDDASADGADACAALRYMVMTWLRAAPKPDVKRKANRNADPSLKRLQEALRRQHGGRF